MNLIWLTDTHLNFISFQQRKIFYREIQETKSNGVLISGDIAEAPTVSNILTEMNDFLRIPIYFVLGNHDYYDGQIEKVRAEMHTLTRSFDHLFWLPTGIQWLNAKTCLVGQDGWADGRIGNFEKSSLSLKDSFRIVDLHQEKIRTPLHLLKKMQDLADFDATKLKENLLEAIQNKPQQIIVLTHVPPFKEASFHQGKINDDHWLPYFTSKAIGDVLLEVASFYPAIKFSVFCGHTHSRAIYSPLSNLTVETGEVHDNQPGIQRVFSLNTD